MAASREESQKVAAFNLGVGEAIKVKKFHNLSKQSFYRFLNNHDALRSFDLFLISFIQFKSKILNHIRRKMATSGALAIAAYLNDITTANFPVA